MRIFIIFTLISFSNVYCQEINEKSIEDIGTTYIELQLINHEQDPELPIAIKNIIVIINKENDIPVRIASLKQLIIDHKINNSVFYISTLSQINSLSKRDEQLKNLLISIQNRRYFLDSSLYIISEKNLYKSYELKRNENNNEEGYLLEIRKSLTNNQWDKIKDFILEVK